MVGAAHAAQQQIIIGQVEVCASKAIDFDAHGGSIKIKAGSDFNSIGTYEGDLKSPKRINPEHAMDIKYAGNVCA